MPTTWTWGPLSHRAPKFAPIASSYADAQRADLKDSPMCDGFVTT